MRSPTTAVALVLGLVVAAAVLCRTADGAGCHGSPDFGQPNAVPINEDAPKLVKTYVNGSAVGALYEAGDQDPFYIVHVWGSPYEMGYAMGQLLGPSTRTFLNAVWEYMKQQIEEQIKFLPQWLQDKIADAGLDVALDLTWDLMAPWIGPYYVEEMHGVIDATGGSHEDFLRMKRIHMIGDLTQGKCSMIGAWGAALGPDAKTGLLQVRALDWDVDGPFKDHPAITVYHPSSDNGQAFLNVGWTGWIASITGMSSAQMAVSEIGVAFPGTDFKGERRVGYPFPMMLRDVLQFDASIDAALHRIGGANRTCDLLLGVGDGKKEPKSEAFRGMAVDWKTFNVYDDTNLEPLLNGSHPRIQDVVYWGMDWICPGYDAVLSAQLQKHYGNITAETIIGDVLSVVQTGDLHIAVYDLTGMLLYIANARSSSQTGGSAYAYGRQFTRLDAKALFGMTPPQQ